MDNQDDDGPRRRATLAALQELARARIQAEVQQAPPQQDTSVSDDWQRGFAMAPLTNPLASVGTAELVRLAQNLHNAQQLQAVQQLQQQLALAPQISVFQSPWGLSHQWGSTSSLPASNAGLLPSLVGQLQQDRGGNVTADTQHLSQAIALQNLDVLGAVTFLTNAPAASMPTSSPVQGPFRLSHNDLLAAAIRLQPAAEAAPPWDPTVTSDREQMAVSAQLQASLSMQLLEPSRAAQNPVSSLVASGFASAAGPNIPPHVGATNVRGRARRTYRHESFPERLYRMLGEIDDDGQQDIVGFTLDGTAFEIRKAQAFAEEVVPRYFRHNRMASFRRQLSMYGFKRLRHDLGQATYRHEQFIRGRPELCKTLTRVKEIESEGGPSGAVGGPRR